MAQATSQGSGEQTAASDLGALVDGSAYIGEVFSLGYSEALVQIHDFHRRQVGGVPALSFLIATRIPPGRPWAFSFTDEDASVVLLRVLDHAALPNEQEALRVRVDVARRVSGSDKTWDDKDVMDTMTNQHLGFAGVRCRVMGTYYVDQTASDAQPEFRLAFGSDLSNYYPNRGLKVYKPTDRVLKAIVNFRDPRNTADAAVRVSVGEVRYASSNRPFQKIGGVRVELSPLDLLGPVPSTVFQAVSRAGVIEVQSLDRASSCRCFVRLLRCHARRSVWSRDRGGVEQLAAVGVEGGLLCLLGQAAVAAPLARTLDDHASHAGRDLHSFSRRYRSRAQREAAIGKGGPPDSQAPRLHAAHSQ